MAQQFLAPSCQIAQFDDAALGQKAAGEQPMPVMDRQIDRVAIIRFLSFLRMMFAGTKPA
jgi:hypothetical protein